MGDKPNKTIMKSQSISEALGLTEVWSKQNLRQVEESWTNHDTVSATFDDLLASLRDTEFGETSEQATTYEKKLMMTGYHAGLHHAEMKLKHMALEMLAERMQGDLLRKLRGEKSEDDE